MPVLEKSEKKAATAARTAVPPIAVNGRYRAHKVAGQQRYANELIQRMGGHLEVLEPSHPLAGLRGHAWEQVALPKAAGDRLLWSPCQAGPAFFTRHCVTFHDVFAIEQPQWFSWQYATFYKKLLPMLAHRASRIITVSEYTKSRVVSLLGVADEKVEAIHSGIASEFCPQSPASIEKARQALKLPSANYLLSVSSLEPRKNVPRLLEAWRAIQSDLPADCWLVLAGANGSAAVFAGQSLDISGLRVHFTGYVEEGLLPALYAGARGFLYPSLAEGFGFPVLEAMACGTPSLTANTTSLPEVVGDGALQVDPQDARAIAQGIREIVGNIDLRTQLSARGTRQARTFTWERTAEKTLRVLQQESDRLRKKGRQSE